MPLTVERDEQARMLGKVSRGVGRINIERIRRRCVIADHAAGKAKAA
jgi:hypothetical protein